MKHLLIASALLLGLSCSAAWADLTPVGDPVDVGSWTQGFNESGSGAFDLVAVKMETYSEDAFESPTHRGLPGGWQGSDSGLVPGTAVEIASATGPSLDNMTWSIAFKDAQNDPLVFNFVAFNGETQIDSARAEWTGSGWSITAGTWSVTREEINAIPAPAALLLGVIGLGLAGWIKRRVA